MWTSEALTGPPALTGLLLLILHCCFVESKALSHPEQSLFLLSDGLGRQPVHGWGSGSGLEKGTRVRHSPGMAGQGHRDKVWTDRVRAGHRQGCEALGLELGPCQMSQSQQQLPGLEVAGSQPPPCPLCCPGVSPQDQQWEGDALSWPWAPAAKPHNSGPIGPTVPPGQHVFLSILPP